MPLKRVPLALLPLAAVLVAGCSAGTSTNGDKNGKSGPTISPGRAGLPQEPGPEKCKKVSYGLLDNTPESPAEPEVILAISCDGSTVGSYYRYKTAGRPGRRRGDRGPTLSSTAES